MNNRQLTKEIEIREKTFQISKTDARTACWLFSFISSKATTVPEALGKCTRAEFREIQDLLLSKIFRLDIEGDKKFPVPILTGAGNFSDPDYNSDADLVYNLTVHAIMFNIEPFLAESGSSSQPQ